MLGPTSPNIGPSWSQLRAGDATTGPIRLSYGELGIRTPIASAKRVPKLVTRRLPFSRAMVAGRGGERSGPLVAQTLGSRVNPGVGVFTGEARRVVDDGVPDHATGGHGRDAQSRNMRDRSERGPRSHRAPEFIVHGVQPHRERNGFATAQGHYSAAWDPPCRRRSNPGRFRRWKSERLRESMTGCRRW
jgi:hypothetical protein